MSMNLTYRPEIDGLRALAVLPVIFFHAGFNGFSGGFVGVDIFFVISGYLITSILIRELSNSSFSIVNFYERRARRILPALALVLFACIPFAWFWLLPAQYKDFSQSLVAVSAFASNILFWIKSGYFDAASELKPLIHTWSLAVEEQYYVFFPLLLLFFWGYGKNITLAIIVFITVVSFLVADQNLLNDSSANFYLIISRLWELGVGSIVAFLIPFIKRQRVSDEIFSAIGLMAIVYSIAFFSDLTPFPGRFALFPTIGTALIIIFCSPNTLVGRIFTLKYVVWIGLISYSLYLWHQPIFAFMRVRSIGHPSTLMFILSIALAILIAYLSYRYVEKPFRNKQKINRGRIFQISGITTVIFISIGLFGSFKEGFPGRMDQKVLDTLQYSNSYSGRTKACWKAIEEESYLKSELCILGDQKVSPQYVLMGDSHSAVIIDPLSDALASLNKSAINLSYNSCLPIKVGSFNEKGKTQESCDKLRGWVFSNLDDLPNTFILLARWSLFVNSSRFDNQEGGIESGKRVFWDMELASSDYQLSLLDEYERGISTLIEAGKNVVLIYPVPEAGWVVPLEIAKRLHFDTADGGQNLSTSYDQYLTRNSEVLERFDILNGGKRLVRVIPSGLLCSKETARCLNAINGVPLYYDDDHLSLPGAKMLTVEILLKLSDQGWL